MWSQKATQTPRLTKMEPLAFGGAAALGGAARSFIGYMNQSDPKEGFDKKKFVKSVVRGTVSAFFIGLALRTDASDIFEPMIMGFTGDVAVKEGGSALLGFFKKEKK